MKANKRENPPVPPVPFQEIDTTSADEILPESSLDASKPSLEPAIDIGEDEFEYLFVVEVPGIAIEDIEIRGGSGVFEVSGSATLRAAEQSKRYLRVERELGDCHRAFALPPDADVAEMHYDMLNGVLHVHIPKVRPVQIRAEHVESLQSGKEKDLPRLEPYLAISQPNLVRTITSAG